jgi:urease accessory protein
MSVSLPLITALQHGDSQFPGGGFAFSWGLESLQADGLIERGDFKAFLHGQIVHRWASFERVFIAHAHRAADDEAALCGIDELQDAMLVGETARLSSIRAGGALLLAHAQLGTPGAEAWRARIRAATAQGHLATVQGLMLANVGLAEADALTVALYQTLAALCSAATRLSLISHLDGQRALTRLRPVMAAILAAPLPSLAAAAAFAPLTEMAMMRHSGQAGRLFAS